MKECYVVCVVLLLNLLVSENRKTNTRNRQQRTVNRKCIYVCWLFRATRNLPGPASNKYKIIIIPCLPAPLSP